MSILVVNWNTRDLLDRCLASVLAQTHVTFEVIVVDNGSTDGSPDMVRSRHPAVRLLALDENTGFSRGNNLAAGRATGRYLLLLNSDTEMYPGSLSVAIAHADAHPELGAMGLGLRNPDGSPQASCAAFPSVAKELFFSLALHRLLPSRVARRYRLECGAPTEAVRVDWATGAALLIRREAWARVGELDESFFMYGEDLDWCIRATRQGFGIGYAPAARVLHHGDASSETRWRGAVNRVIFRRLRAIVASHHGRAASLAIAVAISLGAAPRWLCFLLASVAGDARTRARRRRRADDYAHTLVGLWGRAPVDAAAERDG